MTICDHCLCHSTEDRPVAKWAVKVLNCYDKDVLEREMELCPTCISRFIHRVEAAVNPPKVNNQKLSLL